MSSNQLNVLWRSGLGADIAEQQKEGLEFNLIIETDNDAAAHHKDWADVLVDGRPEVALLDGARLKHVIVPYVGVNDELREAVLARPNLRLYNSHFNDAFVAQHAVALLLACANRLREADTPMREGSWKPYKGGGLESVFLPGKTCLLLGYGAIGKETEWRLQGLGMKTSALRRHPQNEGNTKEYSPDQLHQALSDADAVVISLPSTPETKGMLDKAAFAAMKQGSLLVNVGRGDVIVQQALYDALTSGKLLSAGIDVWWNYPEARDTEQVFPADVPLHELPNLIMSPHRAASYEASQAVSFNDVIKTLEAIQRGESRNRVDPDKGY